MLEYSINNKKRRNKKNAMIETEAKRRRIQSPGNIIFDLPLDIILKIVAKLPVKSIVACMLLSKPFNHLITSPSFSNIYQTNHPNSSFTAINLVGLKPHCFLQLTEFDQTNVRKKRGVRRKISTAEVFNTENLPGLSSSECGMFSMWGYANGLFCINKLQNGFFDLFVTNPILGQFIALPDPYKYNNNKFFAYGIGYSELTSRHKVLRIVTQYLGDAKYKNHAEIITIGVDRSWRSIGVDRSWRSLEDVNVPYNLLWGYLNSSPQSVMVSFRSALHWVVQPAPLNRAVTLDPNFGGASMCICAFDITEENVKAIQLPQGVSAGSPLLGHLYVLFDKLCIWERPNTLNSLVLWVMDDYGVEASWTKKVRLRNWTQPSGVDFLNLFPLTVSPQGVIVLSDLHNLVFYDMKKRKYLKVIHQSNDHITYPIPFVPSFVSLSNFVRGPRLISNQPSSPASEVPDIGWTRITKALKTGWSAILHYLTPTDLMDQDD